MFANCKTVDEVIKVLKTIDVKSADKNFLYLVLTAKIAELNGTLDDVRRCANAIEF